MKWRNCSICEQPGHDSYQCDTCHYRPLIDNLLINQERSSKYKRFNIRGSKKLRVKQYKPMEIDENSKIETAPIKYCRKKLE